MSRCQVRIGERRDVEDFAELGARWVTFSAEATAEWIRKSSAVLEALVTRSGNGSDGACCRVPENECPPRCVGEVRWQASRGENARAVIEVTNQGSVARRFEFSATSLANETGSGAVPSVTPAFADLAPSQSVAVAVTVAVGETSRSGETYQGEWILKGAYEQCVRLVLEIVPEAVCRLKVGQGDPPERIRAHRWYDHFQCTEPCFRPVERQGPNPNGGAGISTGFSKG